MAKLYFRYGAMNSGKTALLLQAAYNYEERNMKVYIIKPIVDTKGDDYIVSRIGLKRKVDYLFDGNEDLYSYIDKNNIDVNCIFVDEAQFLSKNQVDQLMKIVALKNIPIICYGLRTDFKMNGFPGATRLLEIAHTIEEMKTICRCGKKAMFNLRKIDDKAVFDGNQVEIDNNKKVSYESVCANCYYKELEKNNL